MRLRQDKDETDSQAAHAKARVSSAIVDHDPNKHTDNLSDLNFNLETSISRHKRRKEQGKLDPEARALLGISDKDKIGPKASPETASAKSELQSLSAVDS